MIVIIGSTGKIVQIKWPGISN